MVNAYRSIKILHSYSKFRRSPKEHPISELTTEEVSIKALLVRVLIPQCPGLLSLLSQLLPSNPFRSDSAQVCFQGTQP